MGYPVVNPVAQQYPETAYAPAPFLPQEPVQDVYSSAGSNLAGRPRGTLGTTRPSMTLCLV